MHQQPRRRRLAAAGLADDADRLALADRERDIVDSTHGLARAEQAAANGEVLCETIHAQERLRLAAEVFDRREPGDWRCFTHDAAPGAVFPSPLVGEGGAGAVRDG